MGKYHPNIHKKAFDCR